MEGELQTIPNEMRLSSYQKIVRTSYMPEIGRNIASTECLFVTTEMLAEDIFQLTSFNPVTINVILLHSHAKYSSLNYGTST
jgi:hypothetical protein